MRRKGGIRPASQQNPCSCPYGAGMIHSGKSGRLAPAVPQNALEWLMGAVRVQWLRFVRGSTLLEY